jgi:hypothetical protein
MGEDMMVLHPLAIPDDWLDYDGWIVGCEQWEVLPLDEHVNALGRDAWDLRWHVHKLSTDQLAEIGLDVSRPFVVRWGPSDAAEHSRGILCSGATLEEAAEAANDYMQTIVERWHADEPARRERIAAWARTWLEANDPEWKSDGTS